MPTDELTALACTEVRRLAAEKGFKPEFIDMIVTEYQLWFPYIFERLRAQVTRTGREFEVDRARKYLGTVFVQLISEEHDIDSTPSFADRLLN